MSGRCEGCSLRWMTSRSHKEFTGRWNEKRVSIPRHGFLDKADGFAKLNGLDCSTFAREAMVKLYHATQPFPESMDLHLPLAVRAHGVEPPQQGLVVAKNQRFSTLCGYSTDRTAELARHHSNCEKCKIFEHNALLSIRTRIASQQSCDTDSVAEERRGGDVTAEAICTGDDGQLVVAHPPSQTGKISEDRKEPDFDSVPQETRVDDVGCDESATTNNGDKKTASILCELRVSGAVVSTIGPEVDNGNHPLVASQTSNGEAISKQDHRVQTVLLEENSAHAAESVANKETCKEQHSILEPAIVHSVTRKGKHVDSAMTVNETAWNLDQNKSEFVRSWTPKLIVACPAPPQEAVDQFNRCLEDRVSTGGGTQMDFRWKVLNRLHRPFPFGCSEVAVKNPILLKSNDFEWFNSSILLTRAVAQKVVFLCVCGTVCSALSSLDDHWRRECKTVPKCQSERPPAAVKGTLEHRKDAVWKAHQFGGKGVVRLVNEECCRNICRALGLETVNPISFRVGANVSRSSGHIGFGTRDSKSRQKKRPRFVAGVGDQQSNDESENKKGSRHSIASSTMVTK